jgi:hypothetical protein
VATKVLRCSNGSAAMADEHTLYKAERLKAKKNLKSLGTSFQVSQISKLFQTLVG